MGFQFERRYQVWCDCNQWNISGMQNALDIILLVLALGHLRSWIMDNVIHCKLRFYVVSYSYI